MKKNTRSASLLANYTDIKLLLELVSSKVVSIIKNKMTEIIRKAFKFRKPFLFIL